MEPELVLPGSWHGVVGMELGGLFSPAEFTMLDETTPEFEANLDKLYRAVCRIVDRQNSAVQSSTAKPNRQLVRAGTSTILGHDAVTV